MDRILEYDNTMHILIEERRVIQHSPTLLSSNNDVPDTIQHKSNHPRPKFNKIFHNEILPKEFDGDGEIANSSDIDLGLKRTSSPVFLVEF